MTQRPTATRTSDYSDVERRRPINDLSAHGTTIRRERAGFSSQSINDHGEKHRQWRQE